MRIIITEQQFNSLLLNEGGPSLWWREIKQAVKLSNNIDDFEIKFIDLYDHARKTGLVGYIKTLFYDKMTPEQIKQEILDGYIDENGKLVKYKGRLDLRKKNQKLYSLSGKISKKYNLMKGVDDILTQVFLGTNRIDWTPELIRQEFKKGDYKGRGDFHTKNQKLYDAARNRGMLDELIPDKLYIDWTPELIRQEFENGDYEGRSDLEKKNNALYSAAKRHDMLDELIPDALRTSWTPELIRQEFKKGDYKSRSDLKIKNYNLYDAARNRGMLDELIPDKLTTDWTPELVRQEFKKGDYKSRTDLNTRNPKLFSAARKRGMLDELIPKK
jgi:hypothetical protein